jgi:3-phosphoshikimate 1-carboxyvinyltransferase
MNLIVHPARRPLSGSVPVPADARVSLAAVTVAALACGKSRIAGLRDGAEQRALCAALAALGVRVEVEASGIFDVHGVGLSGLSAPSAAITSVDSTRLLSLLAGVVAGQPFASVLAGSALDARTQPLASLLAARGARIDAARSSATWNFMPASGRLRAHEQFLSGVDLDLKTALLLSGLYADGPTVLDEAVVASDELERLLDAIGIPIESSASVVKLHPPAQPDELAGFELDVPGDPSSAAWLLGAALLVSDSRVTVRRVNLTPSRAAIIELMRSFGGVIGVTPHGEQVGQPFGEASAASAPLRGRAVSGEPAWRLHRDLALASVLGARARGTTELADLVADAGNDDNPAMSMADLLTSFGVEAQIEDGRLLIEGRPEQPLSAAVIHSHGEPDRVLAATLLGLVADGPTLIVGGECVAEAFPRFIGTVRALGGEVGVSS